MTGVSGLALLIGRPAQPEPARVQTWNDKTARDDALRKVEEVRSRIPSWQRALRKAVEEACSATPRIEMLDGLLRLRQGEHPLDIAGEFRACHSDKGRSVHALLGPHVDHLLVDLEVGGAWWTRACHSIDGGDHFAAAAYATEACDALERALKHALYFSFLNDAAHARIGERRGIDNYCQDWGLDKDQINEMWLWVKNDDLRVADEQLQLAIDTQNRCIYHKGKGVRRYWTALTVLWGGALVWGLIALFFLVLHQAHLTEWPKHWEWRMVVLLLGIAIGATLHLGARGLNVSYDNPIRVYDAGGIWDWLSLRWLGVLQMYIPVAAVLGTMWAAGSAPNSFQDIGMAILAGYSADSLFRKSLERLQTSSQGEDNTAEKESDDKADAASQKDRRAASQAQAQT